MGSRGHGNDLAQLSAFHRHEARAEALQARVVLVARALVDGALAAEFRFQRNHGEAIRLDAAVAATLADKLVDDYAPLRIGELAALAPAALLRGACLVVHERGHARDL